jgi:hypothetical protein
VTPQEQKALTRAITSNRRSLALLDKRINHLRDSYPDLLGDADGDERQPFIYAAIGADGQVGIPFTAANTGENPAFGYIRMHPDSAFSLTSISAARLSRTASLNTEQAFILGHVGFRFYDESSSRWITFTNHNNEPQQKARFPSEAISSLSVFNTGGFRMPAECVFPRSGVVRVEAYTIQTPSVSFPSRALVVVSGYKTFGG